MGHIQPAGDEEEEEEEEELDVNRASGTPWRCRSGFSTEVLQDIEVK